MDCLNWRLNDSGMSNCGSSSKGIMLWVSKAVPNSDGAYFGPRSAIKPSFDATCDIFEDIASNDVFFLNLRRTGSSLPIIPSRSFSSHSRITGFVAGLSSCTTTCSSATSSPDTTISATTFSSTTLSAVVDGLSVSLSKVGVTERETGFAC